MKIYSYVVKNDSGFAPNPFGKFCTLATCKPIIREKIQDGDWVVGTGSIKNVGFDKIIYIMIVNERRTFEEYWNDKRFEYKKADWFSKDSIRKQGDNIYYKDNKGIFHQTPSKHSNKDGTENREKLEHDIKGKFVLISKNFYFFGKNAIKIPEDIQFIIKKGPGHKCDFTELQILKFCNWLNKENYKKGINGSPFLLKEEIDN